MDCWGEEDDGNGDGDEDVAEVAEVADKEVTAPI